MGQQGMKAAQVIDETFAGLARPAAVHRMGREDLAEGRPGDDLVAEVAQFEADGGFKALVAARGEERARSEEKDVPARKEALADFGLASKAGEGRKLEAVKDSGDDN